MGNPRKKARQEDGAGPSTSPDAGGDRRQEMADIARRRAAHFANYREEGETEKDNVHAGGQDITKLGPWSSAIELVNAREKAAEERRARLQGDKRGEEEGDAAGRVQWQPQRDPKLGARPVSAVPELRALCVGMLVEYIDCVESLYGVPDSMRTALAAAACARRKLTPEVARVFASDAPSELVLPDCSALDREAMVAVATLAATPRLESLDLGMCGRGFGDNTLKQPPPGGSLPTEAAEAFAAAAAQCAPRAGSSSPADSEQGVPASKGGQLHALTHLRLGGAYRLNDKGLATVLRVTPHLRHLSVPDACRLTGALLQHLPQLTPHLTHVDLGQCRGIDALSLAAHLPSLKHLSHLVLDGLPEVDDALLGALATGCPALRSLSVCLCARVSDAGVTALAAGCPGLEVLRMDKCEKVTDAGLQALAGGCAHLKVLSVGRLPKLSDAGLVAVAQRGALEALTLHGAGGVTDATLTALARHCHPTLQHLDVSFCRRLTDAGLGVVADRCDKLTSLLVFGCSQISDRFAHGHTNLALLRGEGLRGLGTGVSTTSTATAAA